MAASRSALKWMCFLGQYYIRVSNVKDYSEPITGEYTLEIEYTPKLIDPNEPNDKSYQATFAAMNSGYEGVFNKSDDVDWFEFRMTKDGLAQMSLTNIPTSRMLYATLYDSSLKEQGFYRNDYGDESIFYREEPCLQAPIISSFKPTNGL